MKEKELLLGLLSKTLNMDTTVAEAELYNTDGTVKDDALTNVLNKDSERVKKLKGDTTEVFNNGYKKAQSEVLSKFEGEIKQTLGIVDTDKTGIELVKHAVAVKSNVKIPKLEDLPEDEIKKHPVFLKVETSYNTRLKEETDKLTGEITKLKTVHDAEKAAKLKADFAKKILDEMKPILPKTQEVAISHVNTFLERMAGANVQFVEANGKTSSIMLNADGTRMEDAHGNPLAFDSHVKAQAKLYFEFNAADPKSAGGDPKKKGAGAAAGDDDIQVETPKDENHFMKLMAEANKIADLKKRVATRAKLSELWKAKRNEA